MSEPLSTRLATDLARQIEAAAIDRMTLPELKAKLAEIAGCTVEELPDPDAPWTAADIAAWENLRRLAR